MTFLGYGIGILIIFALLYFGIDAVIHTDRYEKWVWQLIVLSRVKSSKVLGQDMDKIGEDTESIAPQEGYRIWFTRIWGGMLVALALVALCVLIAVLITE